MRILWVKVGGLWPCNTGGRLRSFHILSELARRNELTVMTTHRDDEDPDELARHLPQCKQVISVPFSAPKRSSFRFIGSLLSSWFSVLPVDLYKFRVPALQRKIEAAMRSGDYDICIADFLVAVPNVPTDSRTPVVFFSHNVEYMIWKRLCLNDRNPLRRLVLELEWRKMRHYEASVCRKAAMTIAVSEEDSNHLRGLAPDSTIFPVPTGVDIDYFRPGDTEQEQLFELVFTGSMDWQPNEDSISYFIDKILPLVRQKIPQVTLSVVGRNPSEKLQTMARNAGVTVTGTVDDIRPYVAKASVYIVPLRIGGGTRLKIFEALAMGKAIVSTTIGAEGLPLQEGVHIVRADEPDTFAREVLSLLEDQQRRQKLGQAGRQLMEERYSWSRVSEDFEVYCRTALAGESIEQGSSVPAQS